MTTRKSNPPTTAIELVPKTRDLWRTPEWERLWLATQGRPWRSMAVVPVGGPPKSRVSVKIAHVLARTGMTHLGVPIRVADGTRVPLSQLMDFTAEMERNVGFGDLVLVALAPVAESPVSVPLAQAAQCSILCVVLGANAKDAKDTIDAIGRRNFIGSVVVRPDGLEPASQGGASAVAEDGPGR